MIKNACKVDICPEFIPINHLNINHDKSIYPEAVIRL